ncbi:MAG TPA: hypothetical protein PKC72_00865 [Chitinophagaceae bacterium]|nr:hypothetical protein [Chitinophagaceae bacterium]
MKKFLIIFSAIIFSGSILNCQIPGFSVATDLTIQRNFKKEQKFWAFGQTIHTIFHLDGQNGVYVWFSIYSNGKFKNDVTATAKSTATIPQEINYVNSGKMRLKELSIGWRKYLKGTFDEEKKINIYGYAGFGLLLGRIENTHSVSIDTADYNVPVRSGKANFKRLTFDLGLGVEQPVGGDFFLYGECRAWIPTTDYPSKYIFVNSNAPFTGMICVGLRLLF